MGFKSRSAKVPDWASFFSPQELARFLDLVDADMVGRGLGYDADHLPHGVLWLQRAGTKPSYGLQNLARQCNAADHDRWPSVISSHFDICLRPAKGDGQPIDVDEALPLLKLRLYPARLGTHVQVHRPVAEGIIGALAFDLPDQVVSVSQDQVDRWSRPQDELFARAIDNVKSEPVPQVMAYGDEGDPKVLVLSGESFFAATHALFLERYVATTSHGLVVVMPSRHTVAWHVIESAAALQTLGKLIHYAHQSYANDPGRISTDLFWKRGNAFVRLPSGMNGNKPWVAPPEVFNQLVAGLPVSD